MTDKDREAFTPILGKMLRDALGEIPAAPHPHGFIVIGRGNANPLIAAQ